MPVTNSHLVDFSLTPKKAFNTLIFNNGQGLIHSFQFDSSPERKKNKTKNIISIISGGLFVISPSGHVYPIVLKHW